MTGANGTIEGMSAEFHQDMPPSNDDLANGEQRQLSRSTRAVHVPSTGDVRGRPVSVPIYQTSVFAHDDPEELTASLNDPRGGFGYSRNGNPTVRALEQAIAGLEGAVGAIATSSGMGAIGVALGPQLTSSRRCSMLRRTRARSTVATRSPIHPTPSFAGS